MMIIINIAERSSSAVELRTVNQEDQSLSSHAVMGNFVHPTLPVSSKRNTKSSWSLVPGVYARGSKRSHTGKWRKICCGLTEPKYADLQKAIQTLH